MPEPGIALGSMKAGQGCVRSAHFALACWKHPPNSLNLVFPRILTLLRGERCLVSPTTHRGR